MRDSVLDLIEEFEIKLSGENLVDKVNEELSDVRDGLEKAKKKNQVKEITKKQAEETGLQRIITIVGDI
jgi:hypothetical protein